MPSRTESNQRAELVWDPETLSFEDLVTECQRELFATARRMLGDQGAAEDALQETYMKAFKKLPDLPVGSNVRGWMYRVLVNTVRDLQRRSKTRAKTLEMAKELHALKDEPDPMENSGAYVRKEIEAAIRELPDKYREVLILRSIQNLSYPEVAEALGKPVVSVRTLVHRGKKLLFDKVRHLVKEVEC